MADDPKNPAKRASKGETIGKLLDAFEAAAHADDAGAQYWLARELAPMLGYARWENFSAALERAKLACANSGEEVEDHFRDVAKLVSVGSGAERSIQDCELMRFACYLIALNGDPNKSEIAAAQTYFAVQTRRQEVADQIAAAPPALTEDEKRVLLRVTKQGPQQIARWRRQGRGRGAAARLCDLQE